MAEDEALRDLRERERALLGRCRAFVLGHPDAPGGGLKDVLYLTPCGRWLRVCSRTLVNNDPDWSHIEAAFQVTTRKARELFHHYDRAILPAQLERPGLRRDLELYPGAANDLAERRRIAAVDLRRAKRWRERSQARGKEAARIVRRPVARTLEEWVSQAAIEAEIDRHELADVLEGWSAGWPPESQAPAGSRGPLDAATAGGPPAVAGPAPEEPRDRGPGGDLVPQPPPDPELTACDRDLLRTLRRAGRRLTRGQVLKAMEENGFIHGESTIRNELARLRKTGLLDNASNARPRGYGLTDRGRQLADRLP